MPAVEPGKIRNVAVVGHRGTGKTSLFVTMLDRERADFFRVLEQLRSQLGTQCVAIQLPIGAEHELTGIVDLLHMCAFMDPTGGKEGGPQPIPDAMADQVQEYREKLL